jgi:hypothetical protein
MDLLKQIAIKYISQILLIITLIIVGVFAFRLYQGRKADQGRFQELIGTEDKYKQLNTYVAQLESQYKSQVALNKQLEANWKDVVKQKDEQIKSLSESSYLVKSVEEDDKKPDYIYTEPGPLKGMIVNELRINGKDSPAIGYVAIKADGSTKKANYKFEIKVENAELVDEATGKIRVVSKAFLIADENGLADTKLPDIKKWQGIEYPLPIIGGDILVDPVQSSQTKSFMYWAPRFVAGMNAGVESSQATVKPGVGFSAMGYGFSKNDLDYRLLQVGFDFGDKASNPGINFVPISFRPISSILPNTYLGPGIGVDHTGTFYFINVSFGL